MKLEAYLQRLIERGKSGMAESIGSTARRFCTEFLDEFDYCSQTSALLIGNVQSGKTGQMFGIISAAADRDFFVFVILTTDNVILQQQTLERVKKDLPDFCICGEDDSVAFELNEGIRPTVIVLKKNVSTLRRWRKTFLTSRVLEGNPLFIIDDEADAASLNTKVNQNDVSAINEHLAAIRENAASSVYLEVTGTPQSIFLQTDESGWTPQYTLAFQAGKDYLGGDFFFSSRAPVSRCIGFTDFCINPIESFVVRHLVASAVTFIGGGKVSNALAHVSALTSDHQQVATQVQAELDRLGEDHSLLHDLVAKEVEELQRSAPKVHYDEADVFNCICDEVLSSAKVQVKNSKNDKKESFDSGCNFIIGGNSLGRGVTFPRLNTVLYTRVSKRPQADTIWQHNRIFGYDRDPLLIKVFLPQHLWKLLSDINEQNNSIYAQLESGIRQVKVSFPPGIAPTRRNVLDNRHLKTIVGGANRYPDLVENVSVEAIDSLLANFLGQKFSRVPLSVVREVLAGIRSLDEDFSIEDYGGIFDEIGASSPDEEAVLIVRTNRRVTQGTGALLSPDDWNLGGEFPDSIVLTLYRIEDGHGWGANPVWVPNIRLPSNRVFFVMK